MKEKLLTVSQAAEELNVHRTRVHALIKAGKLKASRLGNILVIEESDLKAVRERKPGRPKLKG